MKLKVREHNSFWKYWWNCKMSPILSPWVLNWRLTLFNRIFPILILWYSNIFVDNANNFFFFEKNLCKFNIHSKNSQLKLLRKAQKRYKILMYFSWLYSSNKDLYDYLSLTSFIWVVWIMTKIIKCFKISLFCSK